MVKIFKMKMNNLNNLYYNTSYIKVNKYFINIFISKIKFYKDYKKVFLKNDNIIQ